MSLIHTLFLISIIVGSTIGGLLLVAFGLSTARAIFDKESEAAWNEADVPKYELRTSQEGYFHKALVALDIFLNVIILAGRQGETISTHALIASGEKKVWGKILNWWLNLMQSSHGYKAASGDLERSSTEVARMRNLLKV